MWYSKRFASNKSKTWNTDIQALAGNFATDTSGGANMKAPGLCFLNAGKNVISLKDW